jgi:hypothetical protein
MSAVEQLLFAVLGVTLLTLSLALSDPHLRIAARDKGEVPINQYTLQSCANP